MVSQICYSFINTYIRWWHLHPLSPSQKSAPILISSKCTFNLLPILLLPFPNPVLILYPHWPLRPHSFSPDNYPWLKLQGTQLISQSSTFPPSFPVLPIWHIQKCYCLSHLIRMLVLRKQGLSFGNCCIPRAWHTELFNQYFLNDWMNEVDEAWIKQVSLGVKEWRLYHKANWGLKKITWSDLDVRKNAQTSGKDRRSQRGKEQLRVIPV